ncbi:AMP-binding protein [Oscillibacter sp.]|uniref:AMP-binding protein n=1 Tax=Oscillibacter sp. TaxID=1945593 RepID=UPI002625F66A|nr:AMP-binding protein [Oscillibacter sp.]MDD3347418.1 AMP-binding protein [Oscillibacter sp.]
MINMPNEKPDYQAPCYDTFPEFLNGIGALFAKRPALSWYTRRKEEYGYTYRELVDRVRALREAICAQGLAGAHIAIASENNAEWLVTFLAAVSCGCVAVCLDIEQSDEGIRDMLRRADVRAVFLSSTFLGICEPLLAEGTVEKIVLIEGTQEGVATSEELCALGFARLNAGEDSAADIVVRPDQTAVLVFTSGTTSKSKIVMLSQKAVLQNVYDGGSYVCFQEKVFTALPFYHAYGLSCAVLISFQQGAHLYINGNLRTVMAELHMAQPDTMLAVPLMVETIHNQIWLNAERAGKAAGLRKVLKMNAVTRKVGVPFCGKVLEDIRKKAVGNLSLIICGGAHLSREISEEFDLFGVQILQGYGISECSPLISVNRRKANKMGSVGLPLPTAQVKLVEGEVYARGPSVMQGYYHDDEETAEAMEDGWFKTGDLGYQDKDGFLYLTGRKKNLIVFKNGKKISPEKLENLFASIPLVKEVMVYGAASGTSVDDVKLTASIYPDPERIQGMTSYEILNLLQKEVAKMNAELPTYQQIQMVTIREKEFPKTGTKKIKRYVE